MSNIDFLNDKINILDNNLNQHKIFNYYDFRNFLIQNYYNKWNINIINRMKYIYNTSDFKDILVHFYENHDDFYNYILEPQELNNGL